MQKRIVTLLCVATIFMTLFLTTPAAGATSEQQSFKATNSVRFIDAKEGGQLDIEKIVIYDDGKSIRFQIFAFSQYDKALLASQHIFILVDADQNIKTGLYAADLELGIDRYVEICYIEDENGNGKFYAYIHDGEQIYAKDTDVTYNGKDLQTTLPLAALGNPIKFNFKAQVVDVGQGNKLLDKVPDDRYSKYATFRTAQAFGDIKVEDWFYNGVSALINAKIVNGYTDGSFKPQKNITRGEFCKTILAALKQSASANASSSFADTRSHWAQSYIEKAKQLGIVGGYANGEFRPDSYITRAEIAKMISTATGLTPKNTPSGFSDCSAHWADHYIATLKSTNIISGYKDGSFKPQGFATRAEVCKIFATLLSH